MNLSVMGPLTPVLTVNPPGGPSKKGESGDHLSIILTGSVLAGALVLAALLIALARKLRSRADAPKAEPSNQLAHFRELYEEGAITEEEFKRLRTVLGGELRRSLDLPGKPAPGKDRPPAPENAAQNAAENAAEKAPETAPETTPDRPPAPEPPPAADGLPLP